VLGELKHDGFSTLRGIFVTEAGDIYVADSGAKTVFRFAEDFTLKESFGKPNTPLFSDTNFEPNKIAVDKSGNMYIIGEGVYSGVIQLAHTGEFLGYFTVNKTKLTASQMLQYLLFSREQMENVTDIVPTTFSNVFLDGAGIVYTTTMGTNEDAVKKHNTSGGNMFKETLFSVSDFVADIYVDRQGIIYFCGTTGYIDVHSKHGELIFTFGSGVSNMDVAGLYSSLPAIAVDKDGNIISKPSQMPDLSKADGWIAGTGNTYYYSKPIAPGDSTPNLLAAALNLEKLQVVEVFADAIQSKPPEAVTKSWRVTIENGIITDAP
jgi:hypothetical protein